MRAVAALLICLGLAVFSSPSCAQQKTFVRDNLASDGIQLEERLRKDFGSPAAPRSAADLARQASQFLARNDPQGALRALGALVTQNPADASAWTSYARASIAAGLVNTDRSWNLFWEATSAAYNGYQRAGTKSDEAGALAVLGDAAARRRVWRLALDAYRASLDRVDDAKIRAVYEPMREEHGFRITDYKVDSDSASPRVCFQFSESLARGRVDFAPYVAVAGASNAAITSEDQQLCVEGLKHGERYAMVIRQGLPSSVGEQLLKSADYEVYVRDRSPQVRFTGKNYVLPRVGQEGIPLVSVNTPVIAVDILRVGDRNLISTVRGDNFLAQINSYAARELVDRDGVKIWTGTVDAKPELNKDVVTAFPVLEAIKNLEPGVYVMLARAGKKSAVSADGNDDSGFGDSVATQWFVVSDLGLTALSGADGLHVLVRSLASAEPRSGVEVRLVARNNEILASKSTGPEGDVTFDAGLSRGTGGMAPGLVVVSDKADYNFLDLQQAAFDLTDRGVKGRVAPTALDAFLYAERGVYRSGETLNLTALLRDANGTATTGLPMTLVVKRPDGVDYKRSIVEDQGLGGRAWSVPLLSGVPSGTWRVQAYVDPKSPAVGETSFLVEDYVPERLDVVLKPQSTLLHSSEPAKIATDARWLYGAPGAGLDVSGDVTIKATDGALPGFPGFVAGLQDEEFEAIKNDLEESFETDAKGHADVSVPIPEVDAPRPVEAKIILRVSETGGRAVERFITLPIAPNTGVIGVKKNFDRLTEGALATFDVIALNANGQRSARKNVQWTLSRVSNDYQWFNSDGRWSFEKVKSSRRIADGKIDIALDAPAKLSAPVSFGTHRLDIRSDDGSDKPTSITFDVGWSGDASADTPDLLETTLDKTLYKSGDLLNLRIASRFAGKASVLIVGNKVNVSRLIDVKVGDNALTIPVSADWGAGAYAVAIAHRPLDQAAKRMPGRAMGLAWFGIDSDAHKLNVSIDAPAKIEPRRSLIVPVRLAGLNPGEDANVTVAAVDVGILNLTRYQLPDPATYYFGQRQLPLEIRDLYGLLIDGMQGVRGALRSGGDAGGHTADGNKPTQEPLARYSGVVKVGADGVAQIPIDIPAFNGTMRVMAVAWSKTRVGSAQQDVIVRDPVVIQATLPRFMVMGDNTRLHLQLDNVEGAAGDYRIDIDPHGPVVLPASAISQSVHLNAGARAAVSIPVTAGGIGSAQFDLRLSGPGTNVTQRFALNVGSGAADLYRRSIQTLQNGQSITLSQDLLADFVPGTGAVSASVSIAGIDVPGLLQALDRYPYGCTEQITSRAMPLLYVNRLASMEQMALDGGLDARIKDAIERILARQDASGAIGLWSVDSPDDLWLDAYATDFLTRARENNFAVPSRPFESALDHLRNSVVNASDVTAGKGEPMAYALYVLARNGRPIIGDLRYLADTKLGAFETPLARAQLGAALALLGDRARAQTLFVSAADLLAKAKASRFARPDYGSRLRDSAGLLALGLEAGIERASITRASLVLQEERAASSYSSTQEQAWMVLAAEALSKETEGLQLNVSGSAHRGAYLHTWRGYALDGAPVVVANAGNVSVQAVITTSGVPLVPDPPAMQGYTIERSFYRMNGDRIEGNSVRQNDRLVVVLKVTEAEAAYAKLMLVDRLPAGLEIDNPDLFDGGSIEALSWIKGEITPSHAEYRDDRFLASFDRDGQKSAQFAVAYIARAVTPGRYVLPPATIEDMYRPQRFGRNASASFDVTER